jgi:cytochrome c oxidase subunit 2
MSGFRLLEPQASTFASSYDWLFFTMVVMCSIVAIGVFVMLTVFSIRYRRGTSADRTPYPGSSHPIEYAWTITPFLIFLGIFVWAAMLYAEAKTPPAGALEVSVVAKQWMWKLQHSEGRREINELHVPLGRPVRLVMTSEDVIHSFYVPAFRLKQDVLPGRYTELWFQATRTGEYRLECAEYCGTDHARMIGKIIVMQPARYATWLAQGNLAPSMAAAGEERFRTLGCSGCHGANASVHAPKLEGVFGHPVHLSDGRTVIADESYIRDSILLPSKDVVAGFVPIMPSFQGQVSEGDLLELIAYIKSLANAAPPPRR